MQTRRPRSKPTSGSPGFPPRSSGSTSTRATPTASAGADSDDQPINDAEVLNVTPTLRSDVRRNHEQILIAARDVFIDRGPDAPLDEIARRASVGNATLYRHFPDRVSLLRAVVLDVYRRVGREAHAALNDEPDAFEALARYMRGALDNRIGAVMPALLGLVPIDDEVARARDDLTHAVERLLNVAHDEGTLRQDVAFGDIGPMLIRLSRPLPGHVPAELDTALAHRQLDVLIDGLRAQPGRAKRPLTGRALSLEDLRTVSRSSISTVGPSR